MQHLDDAIRERAYHLWMADGCKEGRADAHWLTAQRDILAASMADPAMTFAAASPASDERDDAKSARYPAKKVKASPASRKGKRRAA